MRQLNKRQLLARDQELQCREFNDRYPIGTPVRFWTGVREGEGRIAATRSLAQMLGGHTGVVWVEGVSGCISLSHVEAAQ